MGYTGGESDEAYIGTNSMVIALTNTDDDVTEYTVPLVVEKYVYLSLAEEVSNLRVVEGFNETYIYPEVIAGTFGLKDQAVLPDSEIQSLGNFDAKTQTLSIFGAQELDPKLFGSSYVITYFITDEADQIVVKTSKVSFEREVLAGFFYPIDETLTMYRGVPANFTYPEIISGSYQMIDFNFTVTPESLGEYMSVNQSVGEVHSETGKIIAIAFNETEKTLNFNDTLLEEAISARR